MIDVVQNPKKGIGIVFWNARSISDKLDNFKITLRKTYTIKSFVSQKVGSNPTWTAPFWQLQVLISLEMTEK